MTVVDASVAVKWLTAEEGRDAANRVLEAGDSLIGPLLLQVDAHEAFEVWAAMLRGTLHLIPEDEDLPAALKLALE